MNKVLLFSAYHSQKIIIALKILWLQFSKSLNLLIILSENLATLIVVSILMSDLLKRQGATNPQRLPFYRLYNSIIKTKNIPLEVELQTRSLLQIELVAYYVRLLY
jgi:hypothetical protein